MKDGVAIIGAGAAGCFCAVELRRLCPDVSVTVYEAGPKPLAKVAVTGGGRCNLTNSFENVRSLSEVYPRGAQLIRRAFYRFDNRRTMEWFEDEGVALVTQDDGCVFPASQDAMEIVRTLEHLMRATGVRVVTGRKVTSIRELEQKIVIVTTGGGVPGLLDGLDLEIVPPVPSLFTLKIPDEGLKGLMGTVVPEARLSIPGTNFRSEGTLLLTDWGISGPAALRLTSYAARHLAAAQYRVPLAIGWTPMSEEECAQWAARTAAANPRKLVSSTPPPRITDRLWRFILSKAGAREDMRWAEMGTKGMRRLAATVSATPFEVCGRARFKEEFVTCGGVALTEIDPATMESKKHPGLFFAGEVLDIDAVTGGFNLQAAWTTGWIAAHGAASRAHVACD